MAPMVPERIPDDLMVELSGQFSATNQTKQRAIKRTQRGAATFTHPPDSTTYKYFFSHMVKGEMPYFSPCIGICRNKIITKECPWIQLVCSLCSSCWWKPEPMLACFRLQVLIWASAVYHIYWTQNYSKSNCIMELSTLIHAKKEHVGVVIWHVYHLTSIKSGISFTMLHTQACFLNKQHGFKVRFCLILFY